jgi:polysaccharide biosynthesis/export protein
MNLKVGRAVLCAPTPATTMSCGARPGAHGVTRPTSANRFLAPMRVQSWRLKLPINPALLSPPPPRRDRRGRGCPRPGRVFSLFRIWDLFRISIFGFRISLPEGHLTSRYSLITLCLGCLLLAGAGCQSYGPTFNPRPQSGGTGALATLGTNSFDSIASTNRLSPELLRPPSSYFKLGPGDVIEIEILGDRESRSTALVGPDGKIYYSLLPGTFVWGLTLSEAKQKLDDELKRYIRGEPQVALILRAVGSRRIWILGSVQSPGIYTLATPVTALEAISIAGGTLTIPGSTEDLTDLRNSFIMREGQLLSIDFYKLLREGDLSQNIYLEPDDFVYFRSAVSRDVYVLGAVVRPNIVSFSDKISLLSAIAASGGTIGYAYGTHAAIIRGSLSNPKIAIADYNAILKGRSPDIRLEPGDLVYVPFAPYKRLAEFGEQVLSQFVRTIAINEGQNAVIKGGQPVGISVGAGGGVSK